jgi:Predicted membrane protein (DUF2232)
MVQIILVGIGAGIASALLFASFMPGVLISAVLFYLAPLPIMIAALGWSHWAGLTAALVASTGLSMSVDTSGYLFLTFMLGIGIPAWWLCYLALLARPVSTPTGNVLEWYPVGRLVIWAAIMSTLVIIGLLLTLGTSEDAIRNTMRRGLEKIFRLADPQLELRPPADLNNRFDALITVAPPAAAVSITMLNFGSIWLAARIVNLSGRLARPWPELSAMTFPPLTPTLLAAAMICILLTGLVGILSSVFAASLATAYAALGLAVLHAITRNMTHRGLVLAGVYTAIVFIWPVLLLIALLGLIDTAIDIRGRLGQRRGPPTLLT